MRKIRIQPANSLQGEAVVPGDKSIGHRAALIGAISVGPTVATNFPGGADCHSTLACLRQLGVELRVERGTLRVDGRGLGGLLAPVEVLDAGNSGTTVRLLSGILAGHPFRSTIVGDASLSRRPMGRIVEPLELFGASVGTTDGHLPVTISGGHIRAIRYELPVPSAQVKSSVLLAGLHAEGVTSVYESVKTRDHTEIALLAAGARLRTEGGRIEIEGRGELFGRTHRIPGDLSSAAFLVAAALVLPRSRLRLFGVGVNPTRADYLSLLERSGGRIFQEAFRIENGESVADLQVEASSLGPIDVPAVAAAGLIDELPILSVMGAATSGIHIRGASELRFKESDRIRAVVVNLRSIGIEVEEFNDGLKVTGGQIIRGGSIDSFGDHRIAMAFAVAGLVSRTGVEIEDAACVDISFPGFFDLIEGLAQRH